MNTHLVAWLNDQCDNGTQYFSLMPIKRTGVANDFKSRVTLDRIMRPQIFVGYPDGASGVCTLSECSGGETPPDVVQCELTRPYAEGEFKFCTSKLDFTDIDGSDVRCRATLAKFVNLSSTWANKDGVDVIQAWKKFAADIGMPTSFLVPTVRGVETPVRTTFEFGYQLVMWQLMEWMSLRDGTISTTGNPANSVSDNCVKQFWGWDNLTVCDDTLYTLDPACQINAAAKAIALPFKFAPPASVGPTFCIYDDMPLFFNWINQVLECIRMRYVSWGFGGLKPRLIVPRGMAYHFVRAYTLGSLNQTTVTNTGPVIRDELAGAYASGKIRTLLFGDVMIEEDWTLPAATPIPASSNVGFDIRVLPEQFSLDGRDIFNYVYRGYTSPAGQYPQNGMGEFRLYDAGTTERGQTAYRFKVIQNTVGSCISWCIHYRKGLEVNYAGLMGRIGQICLPAAVCTGDYV